jgi:hypothetical protein
MGVISLKPDENVFFPAPFQEDEVYPVIVTSHRVIRIDAKAQKHEVDVGKVTFVGKQSKRPFLFPGIALLLLGLPGVVFGIYLWVSVLGMKGFEEGEEAPVNEAGETVTNPDHTRIYAVASAALGLIFMAGGALLIRKQRHYVNCQAGKAMYKLPVADKTAQTQVLMTIQAAINTQKAQAKAAQQAAAALAAAQAPPPQAKR